MIKKCPVCNSTQFHQTKEKAICRNCGYVHKSMEEVEETKEKWQQ